MLVKHLRSFEVHFCAASLDAAVLVCIQQHTQRPRCKRRLNGCLFNGQKSGKTWINVPKHGEFRVTLEPMVQKLSFDILLFDHPKRVSLWSPAINRKEKVMKGLYIYIYILTRNLSK